MTRKLITNPEELAKEIAATGRVTLEVWEKHFTGLDHRQVRAWLQNHGLPSDMILELKSTEIAVVTPAGILMQVRGSDNGQLGMWGGANNWYENYETCARRELWEETRIFTREGQLTHYEDNHHYHRYANGQQADFITRRYVLVLSYVPEIVLDQESTGMRLITSVENQPILEHQVDYIKRLIEVYYGEY